MIKQKKDQKENKFNKQEEKETVEEEEDEDFEEFEEIDDKNKLVLNASLNQIRILVRQVNRGFENLAMSSRTNKLLRIDSLKNDSQEYKTHTNGLINLRDKRHNGQMKIVVMKLLVGSRITHLEFGS
jgi:hypothetical protein